MFECPSEKGEGSGELSELFVYAPRLLPVLLILMSESVNTEDLSAR